MATTKSAAAAQQPVKVVVRGLAANSYPAQGVFDEATVGEHISELYEQGYRLHEALNMGMAKGDSYGIPEQEVVVVLAFILVLQ